VDSCPIRINGCSTGHLPIHLKISHEVSIVKNINFATVASVDRA